MEKQISSLLLFTILFSASIFGHTILAKIEKILLPFPSKEQQDTLPPVIAPINLEPEKAFIIVEPLPNVLDLPDCEEKIDHKSRVQCFEKVLLARIYQHLEYPEIARQKKVEGTVVIRLSLEADKKLYCIQRFKDLGAYTEVAAVKAANLALQELLKGYESCTSPYSYFKEKSGLVYWHIPVKFKL